MGETIDASLGAIPGERLRPVANPELWLQVAVELDERRTRDYLAAKLKTETARAEKVVAACKTAYPEEG